MIQAGYNLKQNFTDLGQIGNMQVVEKIKTGELFCNKIIEEEKYNKCKEAIDIIKTIKHKNLVQITEVIVDDLKQEVNIIMVKYGRNLKQLIQKDQEFFKNQDNLEDFIRQIIDGYWQLIEVKVIHRDLKPENILCKEIEINQYEFKISDYGYSKVISSNIPHDMTHFEGNFDYKAPEQAGDDYSFRCDVYSFGLILAEIVLNRKLKEEENKQQLQFQPNVSEEIQKLIRSMLILESSQRISWTQLRLRYFYNKKERHLDKRCRSENVITHEKVWIKPICKIEHGNINNEINEIKINFKLKNNKEQINHIVKVLEILNEYSYGYAYLIMEDCDGDLKELLKKQGNFTYEQILEFLEQLCKGYQFLINQDILHRDLKPENILYIKTDKGYIYKLADFEHSFDLKERKKSANTKTGTLMYQAPEVDENKNYDYQCDIFSLGIIILVLSTSIEISGDQMKIMKKKLKEEICITRILEDSPFELTISTMNQKIKELLMQMIRYNPDRRISWAQLTKNIQDLKQQKQSIQSQFQSNKCSSDFNNRNFQKQQQYQQQKNEQQFNGQNPKIQESTNQEKQAQTQSVKTNFNSNQNQQNNQNSINSQVQGRFQQSQQHPRQSNMANQFEISKQQNQQPQHGRTTLENQPLQQWSIQDQHLEKFPQKQCFNQFTQIKNFQGQFQLPASQDKQAQRQKDELHSNNTFSFPKPEIPDNASQINDKQIHQQVNQNCQDNTGLQQKTQQTSLQLQRLLCGSTNPLSKLPNQQSPKLPTQTQQFSCQFNYVIQNKNDANKSFPNFEGQQQTSKNQCAQVCNNAQPFKFNPISTPQQQQQQQYNKFKYQTQDNKQFQQHQMNFNHSSNLNQGQQKGINQILFTPKGTNPQNN
ncbi:unnamed protein product [Paramecium octaurelia]|uniref:Protein kinase domain-containing protein n=1 Tax=Paramecium octaurelia TaxID=43137 RepID=A0A8S1W1Q4_PAROT|nr:unnamed protein product [Paramecium octaurelia]